MFWMSLQPCWTRQGGKKSAERSAFYDKRNGIIYITHLMEEAVDADRVVVMDRGKIVCQGSPREVFSRIDMLRQLDLEATPIGILADLLAREGIAIKGCPLTVEEMVDTLCPLLNLEMSL